MKSTLYIQSNGLEVKDSDLIAQIKKECTANGMKIKDIKTLNVYVKPEEGMAYYTVNDDTKGSIAL